MTITERTLFEQHDARLSDAPTSHAAARRAGEHRTKNQESVLKALRDNPEGLTDFELGALTGLQQTSAGKRRLELERAGLVVRTQKRRPAPSGALAIVFRAVAP